METLTDNGPDQAMIDIHVRFAIMDGDAGRVRELVYAPAFDPNRVFPQGDEAILRELRERTSKYGRLPGTPLEVAAGVGNIEIIAVLLDKDLTFYLSEQYLGQPLYPASESDRRESVAHLIDCGFDPNREHPYGGLPLGATSSRETIELLLERGAEVNGRAGNGSTPLLQAVYSGQEAVQALLDAGADVNAEDNSGVSPLATALDEQYTGITLILLKSGAKMPLLPRGDNPWRRSSLWYALRCVCEKDAELKAFVVETYPEIAGLPD